MQAITQTADDDMSRVPQKINNIVEIFPYGCGLRTPNARGEGVGSMRTPADKGEGSQKLAKSCGRLLCMAP